MLGKRLSSGQKGLKQHPYNPEITLWQMQSHKNPMTEMRAGMGGRRSGRWLNKFQIIVSSQAMITHHKSLQCGNQGGNNNAGAESEGGGWGKVLAPCGDDW